MPGVTARSAAKNTSKSGRAKAAKNTRRVDAALNDELEFCTYGKITKALGNKMFMVINTKKDEHLSHIRGKMARIGVDDVVLLNIRDYESRTGSNCEVYDIMAVFSPKDIHRLIKSRTIPSWMNAKGADSTDGDELHDLFDYDVDESEDEDEDGPTKKDKKNHRKAGKNAIDEASDSDVDIDRI
jgi:translation initiation factor IF-1